ncbi:NAD(P)H-dependent oxidoreductase [Tsukamurella paurometabola]|uniref:NAD(P)H-dependent oxidoreductase n=1 Tax=Tsukamurella paurometabola TaxID=2061 RepID=A0ABS5N9A0_TSUPA|nr:NAD(P)H-dependent oxidoreductase [Tsukamurella paurometabola]MBS4100847.1 NAD(P)H-dependent oxidoreductase [Tsukamurella paurometabola]
MTNQQQSRAVVVTAHPDADSATARTAAAVARGLLRGGYAEVERHDVLIAGFDPTFGRADLGAYRAGGAVPPDVRAEQRHLEEFDAIAVVFPVYWWSLPGPLKGWVDRVFTRDWAYDDTGSGAELAAPKRLYFFAIGAAGESTYRKHGYLDAMRAQLVDGLANYMGAEDSGLFLFGDGESDDTERHRARETAAEDAAAEIAARTLDEAAA